MRNLDDFVAQQAPSWAELEHLVERAGRKPERLGVVDVRRLGAAYRDAVADLALARRRFPSDPIVPRLERLVGRARHVVYRAPSGTSTFRHFVTDRYWRRIVERPAALLISALLLFAPALAAGVWGWRDPGSAGRLAPAEAAAIAEPREPGADLGLAVDEQAEMSAFIFTNNIRVSMLAFAAGITLGIGTAYLLVMNGILLGALAGLAVAAGNGRPFFELVTAHGVLELSCIVVAGAAGLRIGWAIVSPGYRRRAEALQEEARAAVELLLGTSAWLVVAGLVEGFVTPAGIGLDAALAIGFGLGAVFWALAWWRGRGERAGSAAPLTVAPAPSA